VNTWDLGLLEPLPHTNFTSNSDIMPPRTSENFLDDDVDVDGPDREETLRKRFHRGLTSSSSSSTQHSGTDDDSKTGSTIWRQQQQQKRRGGNAARRRRRMGVHGWTGTIATVFTVAALALQLYSPTHPSSSSESSMSTHNEDGFSQILPPSIFSTVLSLIIALTAVTTARSGLDLINHAPISTVIWTSPMIRVTTISSFFYRIFWNDSSNKTHNKPSTSPSPSTTSFQIKVVPPHRDAFRRTATSVYYLCCRIVYNHHVRPWLMSTLTLSLHALPLSPTKHHLLIDWVWACGVVFFVLTKFVPHPRDIEWSNGNTYVFVLPMAAGIAVDAFFQLPSLQCTIGIETQNKICWNDTIVTEFDLLAVLLSALIVAFVFTLAFRGSFDLRKCYWGSAAVVHGICIYLMIKAIPFASSMIEGI
jgi:hypothetical protein